MVIFVLYHSILQTLLGTSTMEDLAKKTSFTYVRIQLQICASQTHLVVEEVPGCCCFGDVDDPQEPHYMHNIFCLNDRMSNYGQYITRYDTDSSSDHNTRTNT